MSIRQFRRLRRWRYVLAAIALLYILIRFSSDADENFDPHATNIRPGEYKLTQVRDDGLLMIEVETQPGQVNSVGVKLLGIAAKDPRELASVIRGLTSDVVRLRFDRRRLDEQGRLQAYVFVNELLLNEELVRRGLALGDTHAADFGAIVRRIKQAEQEARAKKIGVWHISAPASD